MYIEMDSVAQRKHMKQERVCVYIYNYVYMYVCIYIYIYTCLYCMLGTVLNTKTVVK